MFGRIKSQFRITVELLSNLTIPKFITQLEILCAIINKYHPRVIADREHQVEICQRIISRRRTPNRLLNLIESEQLFLVRNPFRVYKPRENLIRVLTGEEPYFLATGRYYLKLINAYKARFRQLKLEPEVRFK